MADHNQAIIRTWLTIDSRGIFFAPTMNAHNVLTTATAPAVVVSAITIKTLSGSSGPSGHDEVHT
jgi:hypothetical protein